MWRTRNWPDRPDYIPPIWFDSGASRWLAADPRRVVVYYCLLPVIGVAAAVYGAVDSRVAWVVVGILLAVEGLYILSRYGSRAMRASRTGGFGV